MTIEDLESLCSQGEKLHAPTQWGCMYVPDRQSDINWIVKNIEKVEACGFIVFESDQFGLLIGLEGLGESHFEKQWSQLYKARYKKSKSKGK